ncbi:TetR/AcrR family transcriptional regulator [Sphingomonas sp. JC676]|uniref:TetR/AcrR family transcriptional regulator n=1 Tax=Sphingomonas sp. JC676 TaxID=2768065 RepID=UPI001CA61FD6|nr:TetR/AcrR family transcriptional regulator [Sphingomonas sp. JC676]
MATRAAILRSARRAFAEVGYDGAGVRSIAQGAGVTAMLVNRYFGSKEHLFAEVVADSMADPVILSPENIASPTIGRDFAAALVGLTGAEEHPLDGFLILFRSASSPVAARIAREQIEAIHQATASAAVRGDRAPQRAALMLSLVAGVQMMRQMIGLRALTEADPGTLAELLAPLFQQLLAPGD